MRCLVIRSKVSIAMLIVLILGLVIPSPVRGVDWVPLRKVWDTQISGLRLAHASSPVIADIDSDGRNEVVFGHRDGILRAYEADGTLKWAAAAVPGINEEECQPQSVPSPIDSSPTVADIDDDGVFEVIVGVGSAELAARYKNGSVVAQAKLSGLLIAVVTLATFGTKITRNLMVTVNQHTQLPQ